MGPVHPAGSSVPTPLVPCTGCRQRTTGSRTTNLLEARTEDTWSPGLHSTSRAALASQHSNVLQSYKNQQESGLASRDLGFPGACLTWSGQGCMSE